MKFRSRMNDVSSMKKFHTLLNAISKIARSCVLRLSPEKFYFILNESLNPDGSPSVWCEIEQSHYFDEYDIEGVHPPEFPDIFLEVDPDQLAKTLGTLIKTSSNPKSLKIKLTRKHDRPCLTFSVEAYNDRLCVHDIPVNLIPKRFWGEYKEPKMPPFEVSVFLPPLKSMKHVVERYKALGNYMTLQANKTGKLRLILETDFVDVKTYFQNLDIPRLDHDVDSRLSEDYGEEEFASVKIELRRFNLLLHAEQINAKKVIANIVSDKMIHIFLVRDDIFMQYYIPAVSD